MPAVSITALGPSSSGTLTAASTVAHLSGNFAHCSITIEAASPSAPTAWAPCLLANDLAELTRPGIIPLALPSGYLFRGFAEPLGPSAGTPSVSLNLD